LRNFFYLCEKILKIDMIKQKYLKSLRVIVSVVVFLMITLLWIEYGTMFLRTIGWIEDVQIFPTAMMFSAGMLIFWMLVSLLFGRVYCSTVCPLGTWLDVVGNVGRRVRKRDYHYSPALTAWRYGSLLVVGICFILNIVLLPALVEPYSLYSRFVLGYLKPLWGCVNNLLAVMGDATGWWGVERVEMMNASLLGVALTGVSMLAVSIPAWFFGRTYCNSVCPIGTLLGMASNQSVWHIDIDTDLCTNCRRCEHVCKASCINMNDHVVDRSRCINCFNCLAACRDNAIFYRPECKQLSIPMMMKITGPKVATDAMGPVEFSEENNHETKNTE
jgi:polyferredoxin